MTVGELIERLAKVDRNKKLFVELNENTGETALVYDTDGIDYDWGVLLILE